MPTTQTTSWDAAQSKEPAPGTAGTLLFKLPTSWVKLYEEKKKKKCGEKPGGNWTENVLSTGVKQYVKAGALCSGDSHLRRQVLCLLWVAERGLAPEMTFCPAVSLASTFKE